MRGGLEGLWVAVLLLAVLGGILALLTQIDGCDVESLRRKVITAAVPKGAATLSVSVPDEETGRVRARATRKVKVA